MATSVYDTIEIQLENNDTITIKPLPIKHLRKFMGVIKQMENADLENEDQAMDIFLEAAEVCLKGLHPDKYADFTSEQIEELLTIPTMLKILEVAGGLKTGDPNLVGVALAGMN